jgi:transposase InsO family protein
LATALDLATRKIFDWAMQDHLRTELALNALIMAAQRQRPGKGLIHHSDRAANMPPRPMPSSLVEWAQSRP